MSDARHLKRLDELEMLYAVSVSKSDESDDTDGGLTKVSVSDTTNFTGLC